MQDAVLLRRPANIAKFATEIGFVEGVKISGNGLWKGIYQFLSIIAKETYPIDNSNRSEIPWEWKRDRPEDFKRATENLNKFPPRIWKCYDSMVKMGRKKLKVDD